MKSLRIVVFAIFVSITIAAQTPAKPSLTMEWVDSEAGMHIADVPKYVWLNDNTAILYDERAPEAQRTFEHFDPATGQRKKLFDGPLAFAALRSAGANTKKDLGLKWPEAIESSGHYAVYEIEDDIFLLDLSSGQVTAVAKTDAEEKSPQFSPDGKKIAFVRANDLYVYDIASKQESRLTQDGSETLLNGTLTWVYWEEIFGRRDIGFWWSPDSASIAFLQTDTKGVAVSTFVDFKPQDPRIIHQVYPKPGGKNPQVRVGVVNIASPQVEWVKIGQSYEWLLRVKWLPDSSAIAVQTMDRPQTHSWLYFADKQTLQAKLILTEADPAWVNIGDDLYFLKKGGFLWASERDGFMHLYRYQMDGTLENQITKGDWAMASSGGLMFWVRQAVVGIDEANDWIYFTALKDGSVNRNLYRIHGDGSGLMRLSTEDGVHRIGMSKDTRFYFDQYSNIHTLPALRLHDSTGKQVSVLAAPRPELLAPGFQYAQLLTIPAADGFKMPAQIMKPRNFDAKKKYPVILHIYGGPSAPTVINGWQASSLFENVMANDGYVMVAIDNRCATGISKQLENTLMPYPGESETADLAAGVRWLKQQPWVDASRVGVWGWSGGGTVTLNLMTRTKEFKAGISGAPVTDWHYYDSKWAEALVKLPQDNAEAYRRSSMVLRAPELSGHLMFIFGTYDDNVHPQNEMAMMNALIEAQKPFEVKIYPMRKHGFTDQPAKLHRDNTMREFWRRAL